MVFHEKLFIYTWKNVNLDSILGEENLYDRILTLLSENPL